MSDLRMSLYIVIAILILVFCGPWIFLYAMKNGNIAYRVICEHGTRC